MRAVSTCSTQLGCCSVELSSGENVFLFVRPVNVGGSYYGEAVVGVKESYVLEQLDFASLEEAGYLYELWSVSPQDGSKDVIAVTYISLGTLAIAAILYFIMTFISGRFVSLMERKMSNGTK